MEIFGGVAQLGEQVIRKAGPDHLTTCTKQILKTEQIPQLGGVAQLGERRVRNAEVDGSIPFRSTKKRLNLKI